MTIERRYAAELRVGAAADGSGAGDEMSLVGYAARFNSPSKDLGGFRETVAPGAFTRALAANADVRCLFNHDSNRVLGRSIAGTLTMKEDDQGLWFRCMLDPNNTEHRNLHSSVKRGDINECSFAFTPNGEKGDHWEDRQDESGKYYISRTLKDVNLIDVSAVTHPAYDTTSLQARAEVITPEIRSIMSEIVKKRTLSIAGVEKRDESVQDTLNCLSKCLAEQFPREDVAKGQCSPSWGKFYMCDTYDGYVIACNDGPGPQEYVSISYVAKPDSDGFVFGTPMPVEKEWVPSERCKSVLGEFRAMTSAHMQAIADQHKQEAADREAAAAAHTAAAEEHSAHAAAHTEAAAAAQQEADRMEKCSATDGDCGIKGCRCQNVMIAARDMDDDYEDYLNLHDEEEQTEDERSAKKVAARAARKDTENRSKGDEQVRTKTVDGKALPAEAFAFVGDPEDTSTWKFPVHDAYHARNALARWGQHTGIPSDEEAKVYKKIVKAAKKFGIEVAETDAEKAAREFKEEMELRFALSMSKPL